MPTNAPITPSDEYLAKGTNGRIFLALSIGWVAIQVGRQLLPPLLPTIITDLTITPFQAGSALTILWATYALLHYPGGRLADVLSRKTILVMGLVILAIGFSLLSVATTYGLFLIAVTVIGTGAGLFFITMRATTADLFVDKRAQAFGVQSAFGNLGAASAAAIALIVLALVTWRGAFLPLAVFFLGLAFALHTWLDEPYVIKRIDLGLLETGLRVFGRPPIRRTLVAYVFLIFAWQGFIGFLPTFLQIEKGFTPTLASAGFATVYLVGMVAGPTGGLVGDRRQKLPVAAGALVLAAIGLGIIVASPFTELIGIGLLVFSIGFWAFPPVMQALLMDTFADQNMGGDFGAFKTIYSGIGSLGPASVGFIAGWHSYTAAYTGLIGCIVLSLIITTVLWRTRTGVTDHAA